MHRSKGMIICFGIASIATLIAVFILKVSVEPSKAYDLSLAVFGSSLVAFLISIVEYSSSKKLDMQLFYYEVMRIGNIMGKILYFDRGISDIPKAIESYLDFYNTDLSVLSIAYSKLDFISKRWHKETISRNIYHQIYDAKREISNDIMIFDLYKNGNFPETHCISLLENLNHRWFQMTQLSNGEQGSIPMKERYNNLMNEAEKFRCSIYGQEYVPCYQSMARDTEL